MKCNLLLTRQARYTLIVFYLFKVYFLCIWAGMLRCWIVAVWSDCKLKATFKIKTLGNPEFKPFILVHSHLFALKPSVIFGYMPMNTYVLYSPLHSFIHSFSFTAFFFTCFDMKMWIHNELTWNSHERSKFSHYVEHWILFAELWLLLLFLLGQVTLSQCDDAIDALDDCNIAFVCVCIICLYRYLNFKAEYIFGMSICLSCCFLRVWKAVIKSLCASDIKFIKFLSFSYTYFLGKSVQFLCLRKSVLCVKRLTHQQKRGRIRKWLHILMLIVC